MSALDQLDAHRARWRAQTTASLEAGDAEAFYPARFVHLPDGRLVIATDAEAFEAETFVLHAPEEDTDSCHAALSKLTEPDEASTDRWTAFHLEARTDTLRLAEIESIRVPGDVLDHGEAVAPNALAPVESALLREINNQRAALAAWCQRAFGVTPEHPVAVGIDQFGLHVRGSVGVARIEPGSRLDEHAARAWITQQLEHTP